MEEESRTRPAGSRSTRVAVIDMGSNSTRLLVADVEGDRVREIDRRNEVTGLGRGVDTCGALAAEAIDDTCAVIAGYIKAYEPLEPDAVVAIATSAVRDASNGSAFAAELRERFALDSRILDGDEEAQLSYLGASAGRDDHDGAQLLIDIGGGSTELVVGTDGEVTFQTSLQAGVVRHTERYLPTDPPEAAGLEALADDVHTLIGEAFHHDFAPSVDRAIAVAGTATSLAAIDLELDPYDPKLVEGHLITLEIAQRRLSELSAMTLAERRTITGLHPRRAPTIVAGITILIQVMRAFGLHEVSVSEHDILYGAALDAARSVAA